MTAPQPSTSERSSGEEKPTRKIDLDYTQLSASALAAITAAVLGSFLGAAGTVIGAALASVVYTVSSTLYNHSLERSRERVRQLALKKTQQFPAQGAAGLARARAAQAPGSAYDAPTDRIDLGAPRWETAPPVRTPLSRRLSLRWPTMAVGTVGAFMIAMFAISSFEVANGQTLAGDPQGISFTNALSGGSDEPAPVEPEPVAPAPTEAPSAEPEPSSAPETTSEAPEDPGAGSTEPEAPAETGSPDGDGADTGGDPADDAVPEIPQAPVPGE